MQPMKSLAKIVHALAVADRYLFSCHDLAACRPDLNATAFNAVLGRAHDNGLILRVCRGCT